MTPGTNNRDELNPRATQTTEQDARSQAPNPRASNIPDDQDRRVRASTKSEHGRSPQKLARASR